MPASPQAVIAAICFALIGAAVSPKSVLAGNSDILPVPALTIYPGEIVSPDKLVRKRYRKSYLKKYRVFNNAEKIIGMQAKRTLLRGRPIPVNSLQQPFLVKKGAVVRVVYRTGGLLIHMPAVALASGSKGGVIQAQNPDTGKVISGTVTGDGDLLMSEF